MQVRRVLIAKEGIAFEKFPSRELEACHEVDFGHAYRTAPSRLRSRLRTTSRKLNVSSESGVRPCPTILGSGLTCCQVTWKNYICLWYTMMHFYQASKAYVEKVCQREEGH